MARTVEVGRAVFASSAQHLELWLSTLITISPSQHSIDIEQLSPYSLLHLLSSGNVWVGRGHGLRVEIGLTWRGDTFPPREFQELINNIVQASVWSQLKLKPTISNEVVLQNGVAHVAVSHCNGDGSYVGQKCHRIFNLVPTADLQPPETIANIQLQVVRFSMDILEPKQHSQLKRSYPSPVGGGSSSQHYDQNLAQDPELDVLSEGILLPDHDLNLASATHNHPPAMVPTKLKRKRTDVRTSTRTSSSPALSCIREERKCKCPTMIADLSLNAPNTLSKEQLAEIQVLTDAAMRLSVCGASKSSSGIKIKANSFGICLADVAPVLWRPGYLGTLAQRAPLLPTISQSIFHAAGARTTSVSLSKKLQKLIDYSVTTTQGGGGQSSCDPSTKAGLIRTSSIAENLWLHMQKNLRTRSTPPLQSFVIRNTDTADRSDLAELLKSAGRHDPPTKNENKKSQIIGTKIEQDNAYPTPVSVHERHYDDHEEAQLIARDSKTFNDDFLLDETTSIMATRHHALGSNSLCIDTKAQAPDLTSVLCPISVRRRPPSSLGVSEDTNALGLSLNEQVAPSVTELHYYVLSEDLLFNEPGSKTE